MSEYLELDKLVALIKAKRGNRGLRETAKEIGGVSASTLSRLEQGKMPDLDTFMRLCTWLNVSPEDLLKTTRESSAHSGKEVPISPDMSTPEIIHAHLRADKELSPETAEALAEMVRAAYNALVDGKLGKQK